jgi:hypothetical protein
VEGTEVHKHALLAVKDCGPFHGEIDAKETTRNKILAFFGYLFLSSMREERTAQGMFLTLEYCGNFEP